VTLTPGEFLADGHLRDKFGRRQLAVRTLHQALASGDTNAAGTLVDGDGREQIVLTDLPSPSGGGLPAGWKDVIADFGATGDGTTDDRAAFQAAHNWAKANNGTIYVPPAKFYAIHPDGGGQGLVFDSWAWRWTGGTGSRLIWKGGAGTGPMISIPSNPTGPWEMDHLNFTCDNVAYDGKLISIYGAAADVQQWHLHHCEFAGFAKALLWLQKVVISTIEYCRFVGDSDYGLWLGQDNYVTAFQVKNCMFAANNVAHIQLDNFDGEMITISECTFEAGTNTPAVVQGPISHCGALVIEKNWCGDASGTIDWFQITSSLQYSAAFIGNYIVNGAINSHAFVLGTGHHFFFGNQVIGAANTYALKSSSGDSQVTDLGNQWQSVGSIWDGSYGSYWQMTSSPGVYPVFPLPLWNPTGQVSLSGSFNDVGTSGIKHGGVGIVANADAQCAITSNFLPVGSVITLIADTAPGNKPPYITAGSGVTLNGPLAATNFRFRSGKSTVTLWQQAANVWVVSGDLDQIQPHFEFAASLTLQFGWENNRIVITAAGANTFTIPTNATAPFAIGTELDVIQGGAGQITFAGAGGVTLDARGGLLHSNGQWSRVRLYKRATDEWILSGDLA
jgi:hypothetical protein